MPHFTLSHSTNHTQIDQALQQLVERYESSFPERIAAYYLTGSYADESDVQTSDVDLDIIFRERFRNTEERQLAEQLRDAFTTRAKRRQLEFDISLTEEETFRTTGIEPNLKLAGQILFGEDICARYPLLSIEEWAHERMHAVYYLLTHVYPREARLNLDYPNWSDEFFGYMNRTVTLADGSEVPCTRNLLRTTGWAATALLAFQARKYVARKRDCHLTYRQHIDDEWGTLLESLYTLCRQRWHYLLPTSPQERQQLRGICQLVQGFEQHFMRQYKQFILTELQAGPEALKQRTREFQQRFPLHDAEVEAALR
ncbi:hypothetical protein KSC_036260 [Ktedonobacter sp. SOSP1-52]|uniref:nucleotidyltransferase domain-containing protein n=1 Tax=Ktedonobacter sp. SOSP1-52 TaxID=2778366 RepID=UPI001915632B|nr:nucleotidyltransferase domain-containing protein [Ktedonobacter sp. SOSP1-52]GHO64734.1 hypothetical protein KSC_036260 [Ktedonobacter sp. SOSP1-52]